MVFAHIRSSFAEAFFPRLSEWSPAGLTILLGWLLSQNPDLMYPAQSPGRGYALLLSIADQSTWALVFYAFGIARIAILFINGAWRRSPHARGVAAALNCFLWAQIMLSFAPIAGFAFAAYTVVLITDFINIFRAMRDARTVDDAYRSRRAPPDVA